MKASKASVGFEAPAKGPHHCSQCRHFEPPHACEIVEGDIDADDWCRRFLARRTIPGSGYRRKSA